MIKLGIIFFVTTVMMNVPNNRNDMMIVFGLKSFIIFTMSFPENALLKTMIPIIA